MLEWIMQRWSTAAWEYKREYDAYEYPQFDTFAPFVSDEIDKAVDPTFCQAWFHYTPFYVTGSATGEGARARTSLRSGSTERRIGLLAKQIEI